MIYLDNNATTHPLPGVIRVVCDTMERFPGNPSSAHPVGTAARNALETARAVVASGLGICDASQIIFTSGGTESINTAFSLLLSEGITQIAVSSVEHSAVLHAADRWAGARVIKRIPVSCDGALDLESLTDFLCAGRTLVSLVLANNETGILSNISAVAQICHRHGALLHVDAIQAAGKTAINVANLDCDAASFSSHKFHGPLGCGILFLRRPSLKEMAGSPLLPGHQENGLRAGTCNLPSILGTAFAINSFGDCSSIQSVMLELRDRLESHLLSAIPGSEIHGLHVPRLPNTTSLHCPARNAADLVARLGQLGLAVSAGAACSTGGTPSHVIQAMGFSPGRANSTLRFSLSRFSTSEEIDEASRLVAQVYHSTLATNPCA